MDSCWCLLVLDESSWGINRPPPGTVWVRPAILPRVCCWNPNSGTSLITAALLARILNEHRALLRLSQPIRAAQSRSNINPLNGLYEVIKSQRLLRIEAEINEHRGWMFHLTVAFWCWTSLGGAAASYWWCTIKQRCAHLLWRVGNCSHLDARGPAFIMLWLVINAVLMGNNDWCAFSSPTRDLVPGKRPKQWKNPFPQLQRNTDEHQLIVENSKLLIIFYYLPIYFAENHEARCCSAASATWKLKIVLSN